jgi:hypothetical protein
MSQLKLSAEAGELEGLSPLGYSIVMSWLAGASVSGKVDDSKIYHLIAFLAGAATTAAVYVFA